jgi:hypothetical protein
MGLSDDTVFSPRVQDAMALRLIDRRLGAAATMEGKIAGLREEWEGFQGVQAGALASAIREYESGQGRAVASDAMASEATGHRSPEVPRWLQAERDLHGIPRSRRRIAAAGLFRRHDDQYVQEGRRCLVVR